MCKKNSMTNKKILGVITARGGSKGIPEKNIKLLGDKPLIAHTIEAAKKSGLITHLIVSTDDENIAEVAKKYGAKVPFMRPEDLAEDKTPHLPVMQHAISFMEKKLKIKFDYVIILQPTSPFRTPEDIDMTIQKLINSDADSAVSLVEIIGDHPIKAKRIKDDRVLPYYEFEKEPARRQDLEKAYKRSSAVYVIKRDVIMNGSLYGEHTIGYIVPRDRSIDIDVPFDWVIAEAMLDNLKKKG